MAGGRKTEYKGGGGECKKGQERREGGKRRQQGGREGRARDETLKTPDIRFSSKLLSFFSTGNRDL